MNNLSQKNVARIFNYKFFSTLSLLGFGTGIIPQVGNALIKPLGNNSSTPKPKFFYGSNGSRIPITSQSSINSGGIGNGSELSTNPKPVPPPIPKRSSSIVFMANLNKSLINQNTSSGTKISSETKEHKSHYTPPSYREPIGDLTKIINTSRHTYKTANKLFDNVLKQMNNATK